jgi:hypothetical protein
MATQQYSLLPLLLHYSTTHYLVVIYENKIEIDGRNLHWLMVDDLNEGRVGGRVELN